MPSIQGNLSPISKPGQSTSNSSKAVNIPEMVVHVPSHQGPPTLRQGSQGLYVAYLQNLLNARIPNPPVLWVDGLFGPKTCARVRQFQMTRRLQVDGIVGPQTWAALEAGPPPIQKRPR